MKMKRYEGGSAVMLNCRPESLFDRASAWCVKDPAYKFVALGNHHLTLQFVGRNLTQNDVAYMLASALGFAEHSGPVPIVYTGKLSIFSTSKGRYLIAHVENTEPLKAARESLLRQFSGAGLKPKDPFPFKPHVTLAEAPPGHSGKEDLRAFETTPFTEELTEVLIKYGPKKMLVKIGERKKEFHEDP